LNQAVEVIARSNAELKLEQLGIGTTASQTVANAAAEKAAAGAAALDRAQQQSGLPPLAPTSRQLPSTTK
jgi:hypothetical protein